MISRKFRGFLAGILAGSAIRSLQQDMVGMENYVVIARAGWVSAWYTVPLALVMLGLAIFLMVFTPGEDGK